MQERIRPGHTLYVVDTAGTETRGRLTAFTPSGLTLVDVNGMARAFDEPQIRQVQRYGDSLWNGALIGLAIATPSMLIGDSRYTCTTSQPPRCTSSNEVGQRVIAIGVATGIGAGIDALMRSRQQVYLAPGQSATHKLRVAPFFHQRGGGLALTLAY